MLLNRDERAALDLNHHEIIADEYEQVVNAPRSSANGALFRRVFKLLPKLKNHMLDIGCGSGQMTQRFGAWFGRVTAVDHSEAMLAVAKQKFASQPALLQRITWIEQDAFVFASETSEKFDFVCAVGFLHHLAPADLEEMLRLLAARLAPGGRMLFAEPLEFDPTDEPALAKWWNRPFCEKFSGYSKVAPDPDEGPIPLAALRQVIAKVGLQIVYERRAWELFPRFNGNWLDKIIIPLLDLFTRRNGVVGMFVVESNT
jgi:SAM-dependent methyltransferase